MVTSGGPRAVAESSIRGWSPADVDRLTEDVIRRIERRARIERERHGR